MSISKSQLEFFIAENFTVKQMAKHFGCSAKSVHRKMKAEGLGIRNNISSDFTDDELDLRVQELHISFPNAGSLVGTLSLQSKDIY